MIKWLRNEFTKTPGYMRVNLSLLTTLAISSVTSTSLLISQQAKSTSVESTLCKSVNQREESVELLLSQIGRSIMEAPQNSKPTYPDMERTTSPERSYPSTKPWER